MFFNTKLFKTLLHETAHWKMWAFNPNPTKVFFIKNFTKGVYTNPNILFYFYIGLNTKGV